ncbi:hypothetical protein Rhopal_003033-T1 [Rhodotorula paludigena]|uniref:Uncharacterized protein n=1 Tax=Rhodotorula paludigena TaxID=86838 RepID=A0AAV5GC46_9BASI|nr:hypothetical protein Rhopal_003033-T1 [Rhodotorula paludigena]
MLNGTRQREHSSDDEGYDQGKRLNVQQLDQGPGHYDIYALPSLVPPAPHLASPSTHFQSCSLIIVNRAAGLATGLGIRIGLASSPADPAVLVPTTDPGFFLPREAGYDASRAVLLGWVEEERLAELEALVRTCEVPRVLDPPRGGEVLEWLLGVGRRLEYEGILSNPELLLGDVLQRR